MSHRSQAEFLQVLKIIEKRFKSSIVTRHLNVFTNLYRDKRPTQDGTNITQMAAETVLIIGENIKKISYECTPSPLIMLFFKTFSIERIIFLKELQMLKRLNPFWYLAKSPHFSWRTIKLAFKLACVLFLPAWGPTVSQQYYNYTKKQVK